MNKKVQSLVLSGIISVNMIASTGQVFADSLIEIEKNIKVERTTVDEIPPEAIVPENEWTKTTKDNIDELWDYKEESQSYILTNYKGGSGKSKVEIPRTISGKSVKLENLNKNVFSFCSFFLLQLF